MLPNIAAHLALPFFTSVTQGSTGSNPPCIVCSNSDSEFRNQFCIILKLDCNLVAVECVQGNGYPGEMQLVPFIPLTVRCGVRCGVGQVNWGWASVVAGNVDGRGGLDRKGTE